MHHTTTIALATLLAANAATAATAREDDATTGAERTVAALGDLRFVIAGGYARFLDTDFDAGGGEVGVDRVMGSFTVSGEANEDTRWSIGIDWEGGWYDFGATGTLASAAGGRPWDAVQSTAILARLDYRLGERWRASAGFLVGFAGENDADAGESVTFGGLLGASYSFSEELNLGAGVFLSSRIEDDILVIPQLLVDWRPCKEFRLSNFAGPEAFPGGAGLEGIWQISDEFELALGGRYTYRRFRLDDTGSAARANGVGVDQGLPVWLRATMRAKCGARVDLVGGFQFMGEMSLEDSAGVELAKEDVEPAPFVGVFASWRF